MSRRRPILMELQRAFARTGWSYTELGERLGWNRVSAYRKLQGQQRIDLDELQRLIAALGLSIELEARG